MMFDLKEDLDLDVCPSLKFQDFVDEGLINDVHDWHFLDKPCLTRLAHEYSLWYKICAVEEEGKNNFRRKKVEEPKDCV